MESHVTAAREPENMARTKLTAMASTMATNAAITKYGAAAVYAAAHRHAAGDVARGLRSVGLHPGTMADVWSSMSAAYSAMSVAERATEAASASSDLVVRVRA